MLVENRLGKIRQRVLKAVIFAVAIPLVFGFSLTASLDVQAAGVPQILSYQGRLTDSSGTLLGSASGTTFYFKFSIYDAVSGGTKLWPSSAPASTSASVISGVFNVGIGDTGNGYPDALDFNFEDDEEVYLQVQVASTSNGTYETISPRQRITSAGYAINSKALRGFVPSQVASGSNVPVLSGGNLTLGGTDPQINATSTNDLVIQGGAGTGDLILVTNGGKVGIGTANPTRSLMVVSTTGTAPFAVYNQSDTASGLGAEFFSDVYSAGGQVATIRNDGGAYFKGSVGIGTAVPSSTLHVLYSANSSANGLAVENTNTGGSAYTVLSLKNDTSFMSGLLRTSAANTSYTGVGSSLIVYQDAAKPIGFVTNNTQRMIIDSSGNVGIGTTLPSSTLHIIGNVTIPDGNKYIFDGADGLTYIQESAGLNLVAGSGRSINLAGGTGTDVTISSTGNVGIGTSTPSAKLSIASTSGNLSNPTVQIGEVYGGITAYSDAFNNKISLGGAYGTVLSLWNQDAGQAQISSNNLLHINAASYLDFQVNSVEKARLTSDGFGIGTSAPSSTLHVVGNQAVFGTIGQATPIITLSSSTGNTRARIDTNNDYGYFRLFNSAESNIVALGGQDVNFVNNGYNFGIGTTTPSTALHVIGETNSSGGFTVATGASGSGLYNTYLNVRGDKNSDTGSYLDFRDNRFSINNLGNGGVQIRVGNTTSTQNPLVVTNDGNVVVGSSTAATLFAVATSTNIFNVTSAGNVGIGTSTPSGNLHVTDPDGDVTIKWTNGGNWSGSIVNSTVTNFNPTRDFLFIDDADGYTEHAGIVGIGTGGVGGPAAKLHVVGTTEQLRLGYNGSNYTSLTVGSTGNLTVNASGTNANISLLPSGTGGVGIGTSTPSSTLHVVGTLTVSATTTIQGRLVDASGNAYVTSTGGGAISTSSAITAFNFPFWSTTGGALSGTSSLYYVTSTDYIGVGTSTPTSLFTVATTTNILNISSSGLVSINSSTPSGAALTVVSRVSSQKGVVLRGASSQSANLLEVQGSSGNIVAGLTASGFLGLGTSTPNSAYLHLVTTDNTVLLKLQRTGSQAGGFNVSNTFYDGGTYGSIFWDALNTTSDFIIRDSSANTHFYVDTSTGRVGVGTGINSDASLSNTFTVIDSAPSIAISNTSSSGKLFKLRVGTSAPGTFDIYDNNSSTVRLAIDAFGKLGIGTSTPTSTLHVMSAATTTVTSVFQATSTQTVDLTQWKSSSSAVLAVVDGTGRFGIGTSTPSTSLYVVGTSTIAGNLMPGADSTYSLGSASMLWKSLHVASSSIVVHADITDTNKFTLDFTGATARIVSDAATPLRVTTGANTGINIDTSGNVGIGVNGGGALLDVAGTLRVGGNFTANNTTVDTSATGGTLMAGAPCPGATFTGNNIAILTPAAATPTTNDIFYNTTIGLHSRIAGVTICAGMEKYLALTDAIAGQVTGNAWAIYTPVSNVGNGTSGFFNNMYAINYLGLASTLAGGFDVAEQYPTHDESIEAGDVVVMDSSEPLFIKKAMGGYDAKLVGVISTNPALTFGNNRGDNWRKVALAGRIPVKISFENGEIEPGDYLTSSASKPGYAMKMTESGVALGMALESASGNAETVMLMVRTGYHNIAPIAGATSEQLQGQFAGAQLSPNEKIIVRAAQFGVDALGQAEILPGDTKVKIVFSQAYENKPIVTVTPTTLANVHYAVIETTTNGFTIAIDSAQSETVGFNWHAFESATEAKLTVSDGSSRLVNITVIESPQPEYAPEPEPVLEPEVVDEQTTEPEASPDEPPVDSSSVPIEEGMPEPVLEEAPIPESETVVAPSEPESVLEGDSVSDSGGAEDAGAL